MKFTTTQENLFKAISSANGSIERKQTLPVLGNMLMSVKNGVLSVTGTDLEAQITSKVSVDIEEEGETTVPALKIFNVVRNISPSAKIKMQLKDNSVFLSSGKSRLKLSTIPSVEFPLMNSEKETESFTPDFSVLSEGINNCMVSMANKDVRFYLNGMLFDIEKGGLTVVTTDGHRLSSYKADCDSDFDKQVIVPKKGIESLLKMLSKTHDIKLSVSDNLMRAVSDEETLVIKLIAGKYPDYKRVIPSKSSIVVSVNLDELKGAAKRAMSIFDGMDKYPNVKFSAENGEATVFTENSQGEKYSESMPVSIDGQNIEIGFSARYFVDALSMVKEDNAVMKMTDSNSSMRIDEGALTAVVMPVRL